MLDAAFLNTLLYERQATLDELKADLAELVLFDRKMNQQATLWGRLAMGCGATLVLGLAFGTCLSDFVPATIGWSMVAVAIIPTIVAAILYGYKSSAILDPRRYELAIALVRHIGRDMRPDAPTLLRLDFRKTQSKPFEQTRQQAGSVTCTDYKQPWFQCRGRLYDGTKFQLEVDQRVDRKETQKRKTTKVREVFQERVVLALTGRADKRPSLKFAPQLVARFLARRVTLRSTRVKGNSLVTTVVTPKGTRRTVRGTTTNAEVEKQLVTPDVLLGVFVSCYRAWRLVRRPLPS